MRSIIFHLYWLEHFYIHWHPIQIPKLYNQKFLKIILIKRGQGQPAHINKKIPSCFHEGILQKRRRPTLPRDAVPSAQTGLTSLFGMVRGEPRRYNHLKLYPAPDAGSLSLKERLISWHTEKSTLGVDIHKKLLYSTKKQAYNKPMGY